MIASICGLKISYSITTHRLPKAKQNASTNDIKLNFFVINFQSIISKRAAFLNLIDDHHPDIIFGTETWLSPTISTAEFLPADYMSFIEKILMDMVGFYLPLETP